MHSWIVTYEVKYPPKNIWHELIQKVQLDKYFGCSIWTWEDWVDCEQCDHIGLLLKDTDKKISYKSYPKISILFELFWKCYYLGKTDVDTSGATVGKDLATLYSNIWSHWLRETPQGRHYGQVMKCLICLPEQSFTLVDAASLDPSTPLILQPKFESHLPRRKIYALFFSLCSLLIDAIVSLSCEENQNMRKRRRRLPIFKPKFHFSKSQIKNFFVCFVPFSKSFESRQDDVHFLYLFLSFAVFRRKIVAGASFLFFHQYRKNLCNSATTSERNNVFLGRELWSSGYERRLMFQRSWVWTLVPYTGWTFFHIYLW